MPGRSKPFALAFSVTHLKKENSKAFFGGKHKDDAFEYVMYDDFNRFAKGVMRAKLLAEGVSFERYLKYGPSEAMTIEDALNSSNGQMIRPPIPDPDIVAHVGDADVGVSQTPLVIQVNYQMESTVYPMASTKIVTTASTQSLIQNGLPVEDVITEIAKTEFKPPYDQHFINCVGKVTCFRTYSVLLTFPNFRVFYAQVYAIPDNPWHKGDAFVLISQASGNETIDGYFSCILYSKNRRGENQKPYVIKLTKPDGALSYRFGVVTIFIRSKGSCKQQAKGYKTLSESVAASEREEEKNVISEPSPPQPQSSDAILRFNGPLPMQPQPQQVQPMQSSQQAMPLQSPALQMSQLSIPIPLVDVNGNSSAASNANWGNAALAVNVNVNNVDVPPPTFDTAHFVGKGFIANTIRDFGVFAAVCLEAFKRKGRRLGSKSLEKDTGVAQGTADKYLRFIMCLINKGIRFRTIANLNENVNEFSRNTLGYAGFTAVTLAHETRYQNMTIAQVEQLFS